MYYEFYIDQFFAEHLLIGYLLLSAAARLLGQAVSRKRLMLASAAEAAVLCALIIIGAPVFYPVGTVVAGMIAFTEKKQEGFFRGMACLLFVTVCFAGTLEALLSLVTLPVAVGAIAAAAILKYAFFAVCCRIKTGGVLEVWLCCGEKKARVFALADSGNRLLEPMTGRPVSIVEGSVIYPLLPAGWEEQSGFLLIPYHSIGKEQGWLRGIAIDSMQVGSGKGTAVYKRPVIAIYEGQVSAKGAYQMILHPMHTTMENRNGRKENDSKNSGTAEVSVQDGVGIRGRAAAQDE